ncbi:MAG: tetratricopeptide repeat protein [Alphaproteobacteria bacterium]|jgi:tol-pal system protein YbgF|nr:tetratricopeptide repeat protein [Alphaproteobacteria bacterium]
MRRACLLVLALLVTAPTALAGETDRRLDKLEGDIDTLYRAVFQGQTPPTDGAPLPLTSGSGRGPTPSLETLDRMQALEDRLRNLTNQVEEQGYAIRQIQERMQAAAAPDPLVQAPSTTAGSVLPPGALGAPLGGGPTGADVTAGQPAQAYAQAYALYQDGQAAAAEAAFRDFLARWPTQELAPNAKHWLGKSQMAKGDYEPAARTFAEGYQVWPRAAKAPDMLLGLALALDKAGRREEACTALTKLRADFPSGTAPAVAKGAQEAKRLSCP